MSESKEPLQAEFFTNFNELLQLQQEVKKATDRLINFKLRCFDGTEIYLFSHADKLASSSNESEKTGSSSEKS